MRTGKNQPSAAPLRHLRVDQVLDLIALYEADKAEYRAIEERLFGPKPATDDNELEPLDMVEFDRRDRLIEAFGRPAHRAYVVGVTSLSAEAMTELIALAWLGRGDDDDFEALCTYQRTHFPPGEGNAGYVLNKSAMPRIYWPAGLAKLGLAGEGG